MNENLYDMPDDIARAEERLQRLGEGRRLANLKLRQISDGILKHSAPLSTSDLACVCEAAVNSSNLARITELENEVADKSQTIAGLNFQLQSPCGAMAVGDANLYQDECLRTANSVQDRLEGLGLAVLALGLTGEAGEVADHIKKHVGHGHAADWDKVAKELGDVLWYVSVLASSAGFSLSEIMSMNIEKLRKRYPNGFSQSDSIKRADMVQSRSEDAESPGSLDTVVQPVSGDIYERTGTYFTLEEYNDGPGPEDDFQRHDQPVLAPREIFSIGR